MGQDKCEADQIKHVKTHMLLTNLRQTYTAKNYV
jgi:hypothetical protein